MNSALAVDCMGGDRGVSVTIPAIETFLTNNTVARVIAVGMPDRLAPEVERLARRFPDRITLEPASQVVAMDELPQSALRTKRDSSMRRAIELVRDGRAVAAVSAGNPVR
jgi:glycerol-3-phosphate acyltransferase PlsX